MVEIFPHRPEPALQFAEIDDPAVRVRLAFDGDARAKRMAVQPAVAIVAIVRIDQRMRRLEAEFLENLKHYLIPIALCVCTLNRQRGWLMQ